MLESVGIITFAEANIDNDKPNKINDNINNFRIFFVIFLLEIFMLVKLFLLDRILFFMQTVILQKIKFT